MYLQEQMNHEELTRRYEHLAGYGQQDTPRRTTLGKRCAPIISFLVMLIIVSHSSVALFTTPPKSFSPSSSLLSRATNESSPLECLQVAAPVLSPPNGCQQTLMVHTFASSYGQPFIGYYSPPKCNFDRVTFNLTVTSKGRQFDRLALMFFNDTEIFRTSTAEPTQYGIVWSYVKDMSAYRSLFNEPQKIIFDLGNLVDDTYTGVWQTTLTATFFTAEEPIDPANLIIPVSARKSSTNASSAFVVPESAAVNTLTLPPNIERAVFSISACGQATEEFWWSNVLSSDTNAFGNEATLYGHSAFREVQVLIDGKMAGVAWPFPIIFTGGVVPGFWRPIVGIDAFDLREDEIDITPFIPLLSDNNTHSFEIRVVGIDDDGHGNGHLTESIGSNWVVTGKIFLWFSESNNTTTGALNTITAPAPSIRLQSTPKNGPNATLESLDYAVEVSRELYIESVLNTSKGPQTVTWKQKLDFSNAGLLSNGGNNQDVRQTTSGTHTSSYGFTQNFDYPLSVNSSYNAPAGGNITINGKMSRGKNVQQIGDLAFPNEWKTFDYSRLNTTPPDLASTRGSSVTNLQNGTASYLSVPAEKRSYGTGNTEQLLTLNRIGGTAMAIVQDGTNGAGAVGQTRDELYQRHIIAKNDSIVYDDQRFGSHAVGPDRYVLLSQGLAQELLPEFAWNGVRSLIGRGPS